MAEIASCIIKLHSQDLAKLEAGVEVPFQLKAEKMKLEEQIKEREDFLQREDTPSFVVGHVNAEIKERKESLLEINVQTSNALKKEKDELKKKYLQLYQIECTKVFKRSPESLGIELPHAESWNEYWSRQ